jgi:hypothetical protein
MNRYFLHFTDWGEDLEIILPERPFIGDGIYLYEFDLKDLSKQLKEEIINSTVTRVEDIRFSIQYKIPCLIAQVKNIE